MSWGFNGTMKKWEHRGIFDGYPLQKTKMDLENLRISRKIIDKGWVVHICHLSAGQLTKIKNLMRDAISHIREWWFSSLWIGGFNPSKSNDSNALLIPIVVKNKGCSAVQTRLILSNKKWRYKLKHLKRDGFTNWNCGWSRYIRKNRAGSKYNEDSTSECRSKCDIVLQITHKIQYVTVCGYKDTHIYIYWL